jgi:hypothetical protein
MITPWDEAGGGSGAGGIEKDVKGLDTATFNPRDIHSRYGRGTIR